MLSDSADCNPARPLPHCSFVAAVDNFAVEVGKFEFRVVDYLAFGDDVVEVEDVAA